MKKPTRRLPPSIRPSKKPRSFGWVFLLISSFLVLGFIGSYCYFPKETPRPSLKILTKKVIPTEDPTFIPKPQDESTDELALVDDLYKETEVVQLYKAQETSSKEYDYWRYAIKDQKTTKPLCAIVIMDVQNLDKKALKKLEQFSCPLTFALQTTSPIYGTLNNIKRKKNWSYVYPLRIEKDLSFKDVGDVLNSHQINSMSYMGVLNQHTPTANSMEHLLIHLKQRGLVLVDASLTSQKTLKDLSYKNLALAIQGEPSLVYDKIKEKKLVLLSLKDLLRPKSQQWIRFQRKKGVQFVSLKEMF